jgi:hypothetical protein
LALFCSSIKRVFKVPRISLSKLQLLISFLAPLPRMYFSNLLLHYSNLILLHFFFFFECRWLEFSP